LVLRFDQQLDRIIGFQPQQLADVIERADSLGCAGIFAWMGAEVDRLHAEGIGELGGKGET
jgi:hypothetical protein